MVATGAQTARTRLPPVSPIAPVPIAPVPQTARTARASTPLTGRLLVDRVPAVMQPELLKLTPTGELATSLLPALDGPSPRGRRGSHFSAFGDGDHDSSRGATPPIGPPAYLKELGLFRGEREEKAPEEAGHLVSLLFGVRDNEVAGGGMGWMDGYLWPDSYARTPGTVGSMHSILRGWCQQ